MLTYQIKVPDSPKTKTRETGNWLGVDLSNDDSEITKSRLSSAINVWRYYGAQGSSSIDTIPGFRRVLEIPTGAETYGIWFFEYITQPEEGEEEDFVYENVVKPLIHAGTRLYLWSDYPDGDTLTVLLGDDTQMMAEQKSTGFSFDNKFYILDGENYLVYDGSTVTNVAADAFIPTTKIGMAPDGGGTTNQQRNLLQPAFKNTFVADGSATAYYLSETELDDTVVTATIYDSEKVENTDFTVNRETGVVTFTSAPATPESSGYDSGYAGVEITAYRTVEGDAGKILNCTLSTVYDNRAWFSGNAQYPNIAYWSMLNDPTYIGQITYTQDGNDNAPIYGFVRVGEYLGIIRSENAADATVYIHYPKETSEDANPKTYPSSQNVSKVGCAAKGACINFRDDPVFISSLGLEGIGKLNVGLERSIEHRSTRIDRSFVNETGLENVVLETWYGYLLCMVNGNLYVADSRYITENNQTGLNEYEWFYWTGIGAYVDQYIRYVWAESLPLWLSGVNLITSELQDETVNPADSDGEETNSPTEHTVTINETTHTYYTALYNGIAYLCVAAQDYIGGTFNEAVILRQYDNMLYFGTKNGAVCVFNTDKIKDVSTGELQVGAFGFDGRAIHSAITTAMDDYEAFNIYKRFNRKGNIVDLKSLAHSSVKYIVETERSAPREYDGRSASYFDFSDIDFGDFTFNTFRRVAMILKPKEKKWKRAKITIFCDEIYKSFGVKSITTIAQYGNYAKE